MIRSRGYTGRKGAQKKAGSNTACQKSVLRINSDVGLGLAQTLNAVARLPLPALLEQVDALEALEDVAFDDEARGALETFVLRHDV